MRKACKRLAQHTLARSPEPAEAEQKTLNEIVEGLNWLAEQADDRGVKVIWVYPAGAPEKIFTSFEPINGKHVPYYSWTGLNWVFNWLDDIYTSHGLTDEWNGAYALANKLRRELKTNWAVEIAVVMDNNDVDHRFSDSIFAYVKDYEPAGSPSSGRPPIVVMTYHNDNYGPNQMDVVTSHEVSHVFGASDEYTRAERPPSTCKDDNSCGPQRAFFQWVSAPNGNCEACNSQSVPCYMRVHAGATCTFTPSELGWRDSDGDGVTDAIDFNSESNLFISPVAPGDLIRIRTLGNEFIWIGSVSPDMMIGNTNAISWDGSMNNDLLAGYYQFYAININGEDYGSLFLDSWLPAQPVLPSHQFYLDTISFTMPHYNLYMRHTIFDSLGNRYSRPRFDVMTRLDTTIRVDIYGYEDGIYRSEVYGWLSNGDLTPVSTIAFINYICGDINNDGLIGAIDDINYLTAFQFGGGPPPPHMAAANVNASPDGSVDISDLTYLIAFAFKGGPEPVCNHSLP